MGTDKLFHKSFTLVALGQVISLLGNTLQRFALTLYILDLTGSAMVFSVVVAVSFLPQIILSPFGGAIADRFSKKWIMVVLDTISGVLLLIYFMMSLQTEQISCLSIGILLFILTMIQSVYEPSVRASIPAIVCQDKLSGANSVVSMISSVTTMIGPAVAGFLYGLYGIKLIFLINTVSFLLSAGMEIFIEIPYQKRICEKNVFVSFIEDIHTGIQFLVHEKPVIFKTILISGSLNLFLVPMYAIGMPYMIKVTFGMSSQLYGVAEGCVGAGMILGALCASHIIHRLPFSKLYMYFYVLIGLIAVMGVSCTSLFIAGFGMKYLSYVLFTLATVGFAVVLAIVNILCLTCLQSGVPMEYMGKTMALVIALSNALNPVGQLIFGGLYETFAKRTWVIYFIVAVCTVMITILMRRMIKRAGLKV